MRTVKGDPEKVLRAFNNLKLTIETPNTNQKLAFLDLQIIIDKSRKLTVDGIKNQQKQVP